MINLLSTQEKGEIRAARFNVKLRSFALLSAGAALLVLAIYGVGFYFVETERAIANQQIERDKQDKEASGRLGAVITQAKTYKANLGIANKVLSSGVSYSTFITDTARILPKGSVLTNLSLSNLGSNARTVGQADTMTLNVRTTSYENALQVQKNLEDSDLFEKVSLSDVVDNQAGANSTATDKKYPFLLTVRAVMSKPKASR